MTIPPPQLHHSPKRDAVLDAAQASFLDLGYAVTSMDLVAERAGVSKATIYAHFASKEDLFAAVIHRRCGGDWWAPDSWPLEDDARATLISTGARLLALMTSPETLAMYRVLVAEAVRHPDLARSFWETGPGRGKIRLIAIFEELARRGQLALRDPWMAADQFAGMLRAEVFHRILLGLPRPDGRTPEDTVAAAVDTILKTYGGQQVVTISRFAGDRAGGPL